MSAAAFPVNEDERLKALQSYQILDTLAEDEFDALVKLASAICGTPVALISLVDRERQWFKAKTGTAVAQTPRDQSFCAHAILNPSETLIVPDARSDARFSDNPLVTGDPHIVFYAGVPLISPEGQPIGSLCVIDKQTRELTGEQLEALKVLSRQVMTRLELKRQLLELEKANMTLLENNVLIQKFARTAAHDIKNPLSSILLTSQVLERTASDDRQRELAGRNVTACKQLIGLVNDMLSYARSATLTEQQEIPLRALLEKVTGLMDVPENAMIELPSETAVIHSSPVSIEQIFLNLLSNAIRYNDKPNISIIVRFREMDSCYELKISDNGIGILPEHLDRIFEESYTTGMADRFQQKGTGIGLYTVRVLIEKLQGSIHAESIPGQQTIFHIRLPKPKLV